MGRRDFLVVWLQALLLSLFPWLRTERGVALAGQAAEAMVPADVVVFKKGTYRIAMSILGIDAPGWQARDPDLSRRWYEMLAKAQAQAQGRDEASPTG